MSIASRITQIEEHIGDIYDTLELGGDSTQNKNIVNINSEIKREYKDFLANGTDVLWNNWEKVSGSGASIFLNNTIQAPMKTNLKGNTSQNGTPTPSSPVEVKTTTGRQEIDISNGTDTQSYEINLGKNLLDVSSFPQNSYVSGGITTLIEGQMLSCSGTATSTSFNIGSSTVTFNLKLKNNTTYTISRTNAISERLYIRLYNSDKTQNQDVQIVANSKSTTFTTTFDVNSCYLFMVGHSSGSVLNIESFGVQIEKGSQASQYSLYKTPIELCKIGTYQDRIFKNSGKNLFNKEDVVDGYYINDYGEFVQRSDLFYSNFISVKPNTKYVNSGKSSWTVTALYNANKEFISRPTYNAITTTNETYYVRVIGLVSEKDRIMLEEGSTPTLYEPFGSGTWYLEKQIGKIVLNGSEDEEWVYQNNNRFYLSRDYFTTDNRPKAGSTPAVIEGLYCNYFNEVTRSQTWIGIEGISYDNPTNNWSTFDIACNSIATTVENFKTWLSTHNTEVYYVLAEPTTTEITDYELINQLNELEKAKSLENQTNISQTADLPFELDVVALKGE